MEIPMSPRKGVDMGGRISCTKKQCVYLVIAVRCRHEARRLIDFAPAHQVLLRLLLHLDVQQAQRVQVHFPVRLELVEEGLGPPVFRPERDRDRLAEPVQLQPAGGGAVHDA